MSSINRHGVNYQSFDALSGFKEAINNANKNHNKVEKPILSVDQEENINDVLNFAISSGSKIMIVFFDDGCFKKYIGYIKKVDDYITFRTGFKIKKTDLINASNVL